MSNVYHSLASGALSQNWSDAGLITANDDWSGVPSIQGFLGDIDTASTTDVDPRTLTGSNVGVLDVIANQTSSSISNGGVAEFAITDPVVALQGSGTADASSLVIYLDATGRENVTVAFNARDIDGSADNAAQQLNVQYRIGSTGTWFNVTNGYFADVTAGPSVATQVTPVAVTLPSAVNNQAQVEVRVLTTNAGSSDEWVGIDDIVVDSTAASGGPPAATVSINDVSITEGDAGTSVMTFAVTRSDNTGAFTVDFSTADGTATVGSDYTAANGTVVFTAGGALTETISVTIAGDTTGEPNEAFTVGLANLVNTAGTASIADASGTGTITNDDFTITRIHDIQGSGATSPLVGQTVTVEAIVVGDFQNGDADTQRNLNGFYLQELAANADANAATSEGIFIFMGSLTADVNEGDRVIVTGTVGEFFGQTQLTATSVTIAEVGAVADVSTLATAIDLPAAAVTLNQDGDYQPDLEAYEGMLVKLPETLTITEQFQLDRFNEIKLVAGERPAQFTHENVPSVIGNDAHLREIGARTITYDDGLNVQNAAIDNLDGFASYNTATAPRMGDTVTNLIGVLDYQWAGNAASGATWRVRSIDSGDNNFVDANPRLAEPADVGGRLKVASFNVLNFFTTLDNGPNTAIGLEPRGANNQAEFDRQIDKLATVLLDLDADILALNELENNFTNDASGNAIDVLVDELNALAGAGTYAWLDPGQQFVGGDAIAVGYIYQPGKVVVAPGTTVQILNDADLASLGLSNLLTQSTIGAIFDGANTSRNVLAVTWQELATGEQFTTAANHFKSKGDGQNVATGLDDDRLDGASNWNQQRLLAATALDAWLDTDPTGTTDGDYLILGDLNSYLKEDPIEYLISQGYENLQETLLTNPYSFVFDGQLGSLDYVLANAAIASQVTGITEWHINADEADALDYNLDFSRPATYFDASVSARVSDHDPILIGLNLGLPPVDYDTYTGLAFNSTVSTDPTGALELTVASSIELTSGAEISAFDPTTDRLFVTSDEGLQVVNFANPSAPVQLATIDFAALGLGSNNVSSVAFKNGVLVATIIAADKTQPGTLAFIDPATGTLLKSITVGANPDQVTFTPNGQKILVANEGELDGSGADADGSVSIVDISAGIASATVQTATFTAFNGQEAALRSQGVRLFEGKSISKDVEPEYIAVAPDGATALVTLQEANAIAILDIATATFTDIVPLGVKDFSKLLADFSDRDGPSNGAAIELKTGAPVFGTFMPDAIASFQANGQAYFVIANEGDDRDDFLPTDETIRINSSNYDLDNTAFPNEGTAGGSGASGAPGTGLKGNDGIGRLTVSNAPGLRGDSDGDGDIDQILTYGSRSFSILDAAGNMVFDSGDIIERIVATGQSGLVFDDTRSDAKGPEPEGVSVATIGDKTYAFVGLERSGGTLVFDVTDPAAVTYTTAAVRVGDLNPEGLLNISAADSPTGTPLLVVANETSNTITTFEVTEMASPIYTLQLLHLADGEAGLLAGAPSSISTFGTAANLAALVDAFDDDFANTLILAGGDNFLPGPFLAGGTDASVAATHNKGNNPGAADIEIHNRIGVEASTIGNHEFDLGTNAFSDVINDTAFPYLSSNLDFSGDSAISGRYQETVGVGGLEEASTLARKIVPSAVVTKGGEQIGLVGATTQIVETISSTGNVEVEGFAGDGSETNDMVLLAAQLQPVIDELIAQGVDKIVVMAHLQQIQFEQQLATLLTGVDIILAAGSNTRLGDADDVAVAFPGHAANFANTYPIVTAGADGKPTLIVNTDNEYTYLGRLVVNFDANGEIIVGDLAGLSATNGAYASTDANVAAAWGDTDGDLTDTAFAEGTKGEQVADITGAVQNVISAQDGTVFGYANVYLEGERNFVRNQETNLGNLTADSQAYALDTALGDAAVSTFVVSLKNGGGIRAQIGSVDFVTGDKEPTLANPAAGKLEGGVSQLDIGNSLRFNNGLMAFDTTAAGLKAILEHGVGVLGNQGRFPQLGGVRFSYDPDLLAGSRVQNVSLIDENDAVVARIVENGVVSTTAPTTITVVTINFLANGGDGYPMKANGENFRFLLNDGTLSAPVDEALNFTAAGVVPANLLGEQQALSDYLAARFPTPETAFDMADTDASADMRTQNLNERSDAVFAGETIVGGPGSDALVGSSGDDKIFGNQGNDTLDGGAGADTLFGNLGNDVIRGGDGNDALDGNQGSDTLIGGLGDDRYTVDNAADVVTEIAGEGFDRVSTTVSYALAAGQSVETLIATSGSGLVLTGNELANTLFGNTGNDTLVGGEGNDVLHGLGGVDTMVGGIGDDTYFVENAADIVIELAGQGFDRLNTTVDVTLGSGQSIEQVAVSGTAGRRVTGNELANTLFGNVGSDILDGGTGNDTLDGRGGADIMIGGLGNDAYYVDNAADIVFELNGEGSDRVLSSIDYIVSTGQSIETLIALGSNGSSLTGNELANTIFGNAGDNTLNGGAGNDVLHGRGGADLFVFGDAWGADRIADFQNDVDTLDFSTVTGLEAYSGLVITQSGANAVISFGGNTVTVVNTNIADLTDDVIV
ncbi:MAG: ExeM/NucH family extracellular endonuclease [Hyphomicrobium aestuarii]|nr:ExeM/NucH family extracellular endonuclease [Hyphomicrobium aestuarii]